MVRTYPAVAPYGTGSGAPVIVKSGAGVAVTCYSLPAPAVYPRGALRSCQLAADAALTTGDGLMKFAKGSHLMLYADGRVKAGFPVASRMTSYVGQVFYAPNGSFRAGYPERSLQGLRTALGQPVPPLVPKRLAVLSADGLGTFETGYVGANARFDGQLPDGRHVPCGGPAPSRLDLFPSGYLRSCRLAEPVLLVREDLTKPSCPAGRTATFDLFGKLLSCTLASDPGA